MFVPTELQSFRQFVVWRREPRPPAKPAKIPHSPLDGRRASVTEPSDWGTFAQALQVVDCFDGPGFVLARTDPFAGVDLDGCRNPHTGELASWAADLVGQFDSYTEVSPSQTGVKIWLRGAVPGGGRRQGQIEAYSHGRFFTITGQKLDGAPAEIKSCPHALEKLLARLGVNSPPHPVISSPASNTRFGLITEVENTGVVGQAELQSILKKARNAANGDRFCRLYDRGDLSEYGGDWSRADFQLCLWLAFWTDRKPMLVDALFRKSALMRPKWDERRGQLTYGQRTIMAALRR